ncbi:MAG TPA: phosphomethylpyrimidine synthase ThiC [Armatimonadota bacterium]|jgi:phosphomethylpyrimidine synthase
MNTVKLPDNLDAATIAAVAAEEHVEEAVLRQGLAAGTIVIMGRAGSPVRPLGVGAGLRTKTNANIGTSPDASSLDTELAKLAAAVAVGADAVMDLSTGGDLNAIRREIRAACPVTLGTVPIYQAAAEAEARWGDIVKVTGDQMLEAIEAHAADGVDFQTLHCGVTRATVAELRSQPRQCGIVSRGGSLLAHWMDVHQAENPLYERFDELLAILKKYNVAASLGDGLRPGATADASDPGQIAETRVLGELVLACRAAGVAVFVEGPGHMPLNQIAGNVLLEKQLCHGAPFYVLGPLVTDVAPGYDHITAAIGGALCAGAGADFLCYVTPAEHLGLPDLDDVVQGVLAARLAAHAGDLVKGVPGAREWDDRMSEARAALDWDRMAELALDPGRVRQFRGERGPQDPDVCSMCGKFCSMKLQRQEALAAAEANSAE